MPALKIIWRIALQANQGAKAQRLNQTAQFFASFCLRAFFTNYFLNRKARPAPTAGLRLRVGNLKRFTAERFDKVNRRTANKIKANRVNHQTCAIALGANIVILHAIGQSETILKA